jgi:hypothetical protein
VGGRVWAEEVITDDDKEPVPALLCLIILRKSYTPQVPFSNATPNTKGMDECHSQLPN